MTHLTATQIRVMTFTPCVTGSLSFLASTALLSNILLNRKKKLKSGRNRIMLAISCMDVVQSIACLLSTFPAPADIPFIYSYGNTTTCEVQGFSAQLSVAAPLYSCALSLHYLGYIYYGNKKKKIPTMFEPTLHFIALGFPIITAIVGQRKKLYNFAGNRCWIAASPAGCEVIDGLECTRGIGASGYRWIFAGIPVLVCLAVVSFCMVAIFFTVRRQEQLMKRRYSNYRMDLPGCHRRSLRHPRDETRPQRRMSENSIGQASLYFEQAVRADARQRHKTSNLLAKRAISYTLAFFFTYMWSFIFRLAELISGQQSFTLLVIVQIFNPLQGFFNYLIYIQPHFSMLRRKNPGHSAIWVLYYATSKFSCEEPSNEPVRRSMTDAVKRLSGRLSSFVVRKNEAMELNQVEGSDASNLSEDEQVIEALWGNGEDH